MKQSTLIIFVFFNLSLLGQNLDKGFDLLNSGQHIEAQGFFEEILQTYPDNKTAKICMGRAMGLGDSKVEALELFQGLKDENPQDLEVLLNLGEAYLWNSKGGDAEDVYKDILNNHPDSFTAHLGLANALASNQDNQRAYERVQKALTLQPDNKQALNSKKFIMIGRAFSLVKSKKFKEAKRWLDSVEIIEPGQKNALEIRALIKSQKQIKIEGARYYSSDNGGNEAEETHFSTSFSLHPKTRTRFGYIHRKTFQTLERKAAFQQNFQLENTFFLRTNLEFSLAVGILQSNSESQNNQQIVSNSAVVYRPDTKNYYRLSHQSEYMNYNSDIVEGNIRQDHFKLEYQYFSTKKIAFYGFGSYTLQSDRNHRKNFFGSLYYQPLSKPIVKLGFSLNHLSYNSNSQSLYFSPELYLLAEAFLQIENLSQSNQKIIYNLMLAPGQQRINQDSWQLTTRVDAQLGFRIKNRVKLMAQVSYSSAAQSNQAGNYDFVRYGLNLGLNF